MAMPVTDTGLLVPTLLSAKDAVVSVSVSTSPATRLSESVTVAFMFPSYRLCTPVAVTVKARGVMFAVVVGWVSV